jgi:hypothetical protein
MSQSAHRETDPNWLLSQQTAQSASDISSLARGHLYAEVQTLSLVNNPAADYKESFAVIQQIFDNLRLAY